VLAGLLGLASVLTLLGWQFRVSALKGAMFGSFVAPNTALCFLLCAASLLLCSSRNRRWAALGRFLALLVTAFAIATIAEWISGRDLGIDRIFFHHRLSDWTLPNPGRISVNSCIGFAIAGLVLLNMRRRSLFAEVLSVLLLLVAYLSIIGYLYSVPALYSLGNIMALPTAGLFLILATALLCSGSGQFLDIALSPYAGGIVARQIIPAIVILMPVFGLLEIRARTSNDLNRELGIALMVLVAVVVLTLLSLRTALLLNRIDRQRHETQAALQLAQKQQAAALEETELTLKRLRLIEEAVNAGTWEFDVPAGISHWPPAISTLWGLPPQPHEVPLEQFVSLVHPDDRERAMAAIHTALASQDNYDVEFRVVWPDRSVHWLAARGTVIRDETARAVKIIGIAMEVTHRHETERALRESEKLAATGRLAATIAHEINNPLEAVVNLIFLVKNEPTLSPEIRTYLDSADVELSRVSHMVRQTLGFYRESSSPVWISLEKLIQQLVRLYRNKMLRKNISLDLQLAPARIFGLEGEIRQVLSNLIANAIDAVPTDGRIAVRLHATRDRVRVIVADNGHGIEPAHLGKLFQAFFTTKKDVGTGLGLWVTKGIVDKHGGRIRLRTRTRPNRSGTVFVVDLPSKAVKLSQTAAQV
jgi:PAS domain S-box-containing protein